MKYYKKVRDKATKTLTDIALEKFIRSEFLRDTTTIFPLTLLTTVTRSIFNFLITSRLKSDIYFFDFFLSLCITVFFSFYSPLLYNILNLILEKEIKDFSTSFIDSIWIRGFEYIQFWKVRLGTAIGLFLILILFFVEINSRMIQEFIVHFLISSAIVDYLNNLTIQKEREKEIKERMSPLSVKVITSPKEVLLTASSSYTNLMSPNIKIKEIKEIKENKKND